MSVEVKVDDDGHCPKCCNMPTVEEIVKCFRCEDGFHGYCQSNSDNPGTKTMVKTFLASSTKGNFKFFCDICLTKMEIDMAQSDKQKVHGLELKIEGMEKKLDEITKLLKEEHVIPKKEVNQGNTVWHDPEKLNTTAIPEEESVQLIRRKLRKQS